jgi:hypothetical protein
MVTCFAKQSVQKTPILNRSSQLSHLAHLKGTRAEHIIEVVGPWSYQGPNAHRLREFGSDWIRSHKIRSDTLLRELPDEFNKENNSGEGYERLREGIGSRIHLPA